MIITVTLNPSIDYILQVPALDTEDTMRATQAFNQAGGKGINVSRVLTRLKVDNVAWGFLGGDTGRWLLDLLNAENVPNNFVQTQVDTRINIILTETETHQQLRVSAPGGAIANSERYTLQTRFENLPSDTRYIAMCGSLPPGIDPSDVRHWMDLANARGIRVILDADGKTLQEGLKGKPFMIKPNTYELSRLTGKPMDKLPEIITAARELIGQGLVEVVATSQAEAGAVLITKDLVLTGKPPQVEALSKVGAGDSMVAGMLTGLMENADWETILQMGIAAGTATVMTPGNELAQPHDYEALLPQIKIETLSA